MLDEALPTYRFHPSSDNPLNSLLYFTHNGSDPSAEYILKRPVPSTSKNQYAVGLFDANYDGVVFAEVLVKPEWTQPTLSAAEVRAQNNAGGAAVPPAVTPVVPDTFAISLYNPDQVITVQHQQGKWGKSDSWEFEVPEQSFKVPSRSQLDKDNQLKLAESAPKVVFRWKRDGRLSKDMTCYMTGRNAGGKKSKEPDITVALFHGGKGESAVSIYEPNMPRVEVEDRKGLEVAFLLSAEVVRDLYLSPRQDPFNATASGAPTPVAGAVGRPPPRQQTTPPAAGPVMSGALSNVRPSSTQPPPNSSSNGGTSGAPPTNAKAEIDAETKRLKAMVAEEQRQAREREKRDAEEQKRIKKMLEQEDKERRKREAEIEKETERLRKQYGVPTPPAQGKTSPALPPRPQFGTSLQPAPGPGGWFGPPQGGYHQQPPRPSSAGPMPTYYAPPPSGPPPPGPPPPGMQGPPPGQGNNGGKTKHSNPFSGLFGGSSSSSSSRPQDWRKVEKKRSVHF